MLKIDKTIVNRLRKSCQSFIESEEELDVARKLTTMVYGEKAGQDFATKASITNKKAKTIIDALSTSGFKTPTYSLLLFPFSIYGLEMDYDRLLLSGIKVNGVKKREENELMDEFEKDLWKYEVEMSTYIDEEYKIKIADTREFLKSYSAYIDYFYDNIPFELDERFDYFAVYHSLMLKMALYVYYCATGIEREEKMYKAILACYLSQLKTTTEAPYLVLDGLISDMYREHKEMEAIKKSVEKSIDKETSVYEVSKTSLNRLRSDLKKIARANEKAAKNIDEILQIIEKYRTLASSIKDREKIIHAQKTFYNKLRGLLARLPQFKTDGYETVDELFRVLEDYKKPFIDGARKFDMMALNIDKTDVLYAPIICLLHEDEEFDYFLLFLKTLKNNVQVETSSKALDTYEKALFEQSTALANLIENDFTIRIDNLGAFAEALSKYLTYFYYNTPLLEERSDSDFEKIHNRLLLSLVLYVIYCAYDVRFDKSGINYLKKYLDILIDSKASIGDIASGLYIFILKLYEKNAEQIKEMRRKAGEQSPFEISSYIKNGVVIKLCDEEIFDKIVANLPESDRENVKNLMNSAWEQERKREFAKRFDICKDDILSLQQKEAYDKFRYNPNCQDIISSIDEIIAMYMPETDENKKILLGEIPAYFNQLTKRGFIIDEEEKKIYFYMDGEDGFMEPAILLSARSDRKCSSEQVVTSIRAVVEGKDESAKQIGTFSAQPIKAYGQYYQVYYVDAQAKIIIIDGGVGAQALKRVKRIVESPDFCTFAASVLNDEIRPNDYLLDTIAKDLSQRSMQFKKKK